MNERALQLCKPLHDKLMDFYNGGVNRFTTEETAQMSEAHMHQYKRAFALCCSDTINAGLRNISSEYAKYCRENG